MSLEIRVKDLCKSYGFTLADLAKKINVQPSSLSQILRGNPTLSKLQAIAAALGISPAELFASQPTNTIICPHCGKLIKVEKGE